MIPAEIKMIRIVAESGADPLSVLQRLGGYYECPKDGQGKRLGPLVGYAGKDKKDRQFVGEIYANFGEMEQWPCLLELFSKRLRHSYDLEDFNCLCGAPLGGMTFGAILADLLGCRFIFPEKVVLAAATENQREESKLVFARHKVIPSERVAIVEDVANNFSTTDKLIESIQGAGATAEAIICLLNRSLTVNEAYSSPVAGRNIPVISLVRKPINQWKQDDPAVAEDVANGNVVWKPKGEWERLMVAMEKK